MKTLLYGCNGQVGWELQRSLATFGDLIAVDVGSVDPNGDLANTSELEKTIRAIRPDVIVNAAAYTAVDRAESEIELCRAVNASAPGVLANEARRIGAWLVHYSTDYVFDGSGEAFRNESESTSPLNVYGQTKLESEILIQESGCNHLTFRTSWVFAARGSNFIKTILRLAKERETLSIVDDQIGAPTGADQIADITALALRHATKNTNVSGLYHLAAGGATSWHGYADFVVREARAAGAKLTVEPKAINAVPSSAFPTAAVRPKNSRLGTEKLRNTFSVTLPDWRVGVSRTLTEIVNANEWAK